MTARRGVVAAGLVAVVAAGAAACVATKPPATPAAGALKYPALAAPEIPPALRVTPAIRERHEQAWQRLQAGDRRGATRDYQALLKQMPGFYPAEVGLGDVLLAGEDFREAAARFTAVTRSNERYLPAWIGLADAQLGAKNDAEAIAALERVLSLDPSRDAARSRLEIAKLRQVQALVDAGRRARQSGKFAEAREPLSQALALSPDSTLVLRELTLAEMAGGEVDAAEGHARRAAQLDASDAEAQVALADVLEARGKYRDAAASFAKALALEARPEWRERAAALREKADLAALPPEFREVATAESVTRAQVAAYIGLKLPNLVERAPKRTPGVATDIRNHWAATWIVPVTQAGIMEIFSNHTFQPAATVRRSDLAQIVARLVAIAAADRAAELTAWQGARPRFADLPPTNVSYRASALAVSAGAMTAEGDRFQPTRAASGPELAAAIARIDQLTRSGRR